MTFTQGTISQETPQPSIIRISLKITYLKFRSNLPEAKRLPNWGRETHINIGNLTITGSDNGLSPGRRPAIIWTNDEILLNGPLGTNFSEILIEIDTFSFNKMHLKVPSILCRPQCVKGTYPGKGGNGIAANALCTPLSDTSMEWDPRNS